MQQLTLVGTYRAIKSQYPEHILLMLVGDFYEAFDDDAHKLARACKLTVTHLNTEERPAIAGFPREQSAQMLEQLLEQGFTAALAEPTRESVPDEQIERVRTEGALVT